jgi:hypothetical protein
MKSARWWITGLLMGSMAIACGPGGGNMPQPDGGMGGDAEMPDGSMGGDGGRTDGGGTDGGRTDGGPTTTGPCVPSAIIDLTTMMPGGDGAIHYRGNNNMAPMSGGVPAPADCVGKMGMQSYQVAFRYRMRGNALLRASTVSMNTDRQFDTVVQIADTCDRGAMSLACNDDADFRNGVFQSTATTEAPLPMGREVTILVGGLTPMYMMNRAQGAFELIVSEVQPIATGMSCMPQTDVCVMGSDCLPVRNSTTMFTCQQQGTAGALCRATEPRCNTGLTCSATSPMNQGVCRAAAMTGMACDPAQRFDVCPTGVNCVRSLTDPNMGTCVAAGGRGGACRMTDPRCDTGLTCSAAAGMAGTCRATVPAMMDCDPTGATTVCATGTVCALQSATTAQCRAALAEVEPNNTPMMPQMPAVTMSTAFTGAIGPMGSDVDCFAVTVPAMGSLVLETNDGNGGCPMGADTLLRLYNASGMMLAEDDDNGPGTCSRIDGSRTGPAHALAAGNYVVCVSSFGMMPMPIASYTLNIAVVP